jgi:hypothetical protein
MNPQSIKNQHLRDLYWAMSSPSLVSGLNETFISRIFEPLLTLLQNGALDPIEFEEHLASAHYPKRLGSHFEALVHFALKKSPLIGHLHTNVPVRKDGITLGEFDCLFFEKARPQWIHWEIAVKYYLYSPSSSLSEASSFYGPQAKDRLDLKLKKLLDQQLQLGSCEPGKSILESLGMKDVVPQVFVKGYLFYPTSLFLKGVAETPNRICKNHLKGWWTHLSDWSVPVHTETSRWIVLEKPNWLSPIWLADPSSYSTLNLSEIKAHCVAHMNQSDRALLVAELEQSSSGEWNEVSRGFIVHDRWPAL